MKTSDNGINMLKHWEGCVKKNDMHIVYDDKTGRPINLNAPLPRGATIGYGHLLKEGEDFRQGITEAQAVELLRADIAVAERTIQKNVITTLTQNQFDALVSLVYNIGANNFKNSSVIKYINNPKYYNSKYPTIKSAWKAWNKYNGCEMIGLTKRREQEFEMFNS